MPTTRLKFQVFNIHNHGTLPMVTYLPDDKYAVFFTEFTGNQVIKNLSL